MHSPYSPGIALNDYHLLVSMSNDLAGAELFSRVACENRSAIFFATTSKSFFEKSILT